MDDKVRSPEANEGHLENIHPADPIQCLQGDEVQHDQVSRVDPPQDEVLQDEFLNDEFMKEATTDCHPREDGNEEGGAEEDCQDEVLEEVDCKLEDVQMEDDQLEDENSEVNSMETDQAEELMVVSEKLADDPLDVDVSQVIVLPEDPRSRGFDLVQTLLNQCHPAKPPEPKKLRATPGSKKAKNYCIVPTCHEKIGPKFKNKGIKIDRDDAYYLEQWLLGVKDDAKSSLAWKSSEPMICSNHFAYGERSRTKHKLNYLPTAFRSAIGSDVYRVASVSKCAVQGWHYHHKKPEDANCVVRNMIQQFWDYPYKDMRIICKDNKVVECHMAVIACASPVLKKMLEGIQDLNEQCTIMMDYNAHIVLHFLRECYCLEADYVSLKFSREEQLELKSLLHELKVDNFIVEAVKFPRRKSKRQELRQEYDSVVLSEGEAAVHIVRHYDCEECEHKIPKISRTVEPVPLSSAVQELVPEDTAKNSKKSSKKPKPTEEPKPVEEPQPVTVPADDTPSTITLPEMDPDDELVLFDCASCDDIVDTTLRKHNSLLMQLRDIKKPGGKETAIFYQCADCKKAGKKVTDIKQGIPTDSTGWISTGTAKKRTENFVKAIYENLKITESVLCPQCGEVCESTKRLEKHLLRHGKPKYSCTEKECLMKFYTPKEMNKHLVEKHPDDQRLRRCKKCPELVRGTEEVLQEHVQANHDENIEYPYLCENCYTYGTWTQEDLDRHILKYHTKVNEMKQEKYIQCAECPALIARYKMYFHTRDHHNPNLPYQCSYCGYRSVTAMGITHHESHYHFERKESKKRISCEQDCGKSFASIVTMRHHMKRYCKNSTVKEDMIQRERERGKLDNRRLKCRANQQKLTELRRQYEETKDTSKTAENTEN